MTDNELMMQFMHLQNRELDECYKDLDSIDNLNSNPLATRCAGHKAARLAFVLGYRAAEKERT